MRPDTSQAPGFCRALYPEVSPPSNDENDQNTINSIKGPKFRNKFEFSKLPGELTKGGALVHSAVTTVTVDSGACDNIGPPKAFPNTQIEQTDESGRVYGACGGEAVTNVGCKQVTYQTSENRVKTAEFQIGDKITKPLLSVSKEASLGKGIWFGPGPKFESFIVDDPEAFVIHNGNTTKIQLTNGIYELDVREITK